MDDRFILIHEWMVKEADLSGNELILFALIYGYSRDGNWFQGTISYICKRTGMSRNSAIRALHSLCEDGFLQKRDRPYKGMKYVEYQSVPSAKMGPVPKRDKGSAKMGPDPVPKWDTNKVNKKVKTKKSTRARTRNKFLDFPQRTNTDYDYIERVLTGQVSKPVDSVEI